MSDQGVKFLTLHKENPDLNQYWYSLSTIKFLAEQAQTAQYACFLSTPSVFFSIKVPQAKNHVLFDLDSSFAKNNEDRYYKYDFNKPQQIPQKYHNAFDFVLADPPFITHEVWGKFAAAIKLIIKKDADGKPSGRILLSTIDENEEYLKKELGVRRVKWRPSIPHLVYQYSLYANYEEEALQKGNPQIVE